MKRNLTIGLIFLFGVSVFFSACKTKTDDPDPAFSLTQEELNKATNVKELDVTGRKYGNDVSIPHGGSGLSTEQTYRDIYNNGSKKSTDAVNSVGTIYTKRTHMKNADGSKGNLLVTFAMVKRESGYYANGGDWEYIMMPNDGSNDYGANPNGALPAEGTDGRGQLASCAACHAKAAESDYIFANGLVPEFKVTQADLNAAVMEEDLMVTGTKYGEDVSIPHNGMPISVDSTYRDIYSNIGMKEDLRVAAILTKATFMKKPDGSKGDLQVTFAMIKREEGYYPDGGDFEYVLMPNDGTNDYETNPNGILPDESSPMRGKLANCASCHSKVEGFSFVRGKPM